MNATIPDRDAKRIRTLGILQLVTALIAVGALAIAIIDFNAKATEITQSRQQSRVDSCYLLRGLVLEAASPNRHKKVRVFLDKSPLGDCVAYGRNFGER